MIDGARADVVGNGEGIGEGMMVARLFPSTDNADERTHGGADGRNEENVHLLIFLVVGDISLSFHFHTLRLNWS